MSPDQPIHPKAIEPSAFQPLSEAGPPPKQQRNPLRWVLAASALLFALVMAFLLTSRSVQLQVLAESDPDIDLGGLAIPFGERYLMRPGSYELAVDAAGYHPHRDTLIVTDEDAQVVQVTMRPLPGRLDIISKPPGARILVDGETVGETPASGLPVEAGARVLELRADRYRPLLTSLEVEGREIRQQLDVTLEPAWAEISIATEPAGATVLVDGENAGTTPATLDILEGDRQLILQLPAYSDYQQDLLVEAGAAQDLGTVVLQPAAGLLSLASTPSGANVTLNGEFQGQTPLEVAVSPGRDHRLVLSRPGYRRHSETINMAAGSSDEKTVRLRAQLGQVRFDVTPADAVLRLNGKPVGKGSQTLSLPAFEHSVEVSKEGYATARQKVTPRPGLEQLVAVTLQTRDAARLAALKPEVTTALGQTMLLFNPAESPLAEFTMGASRREPGRRANEVLHPVRLERMFYLQTTEVTNAQFRQFLASHNSGQIEGNSLNRQHQPVVQVSWQQAARFANWLSRREGMQPFYRETNGIVSGYNPSSTGYRLPTEAEWAWAARVRGDEVIKFSWGDDFPPTAKVENVADNTSAYVTGRILNGYTDGHVVSAPVASFPPNHSGLYDMGGNVAEWIHDVYTLPPANGPLEVDALGAQGGDNYVIRGASWALSKLAELRLSYRDYGQAGRDDVGFRLARYAE